MLDSQPLSVKNLSHPQFQNQDHHDHSTRIEEYLRGQNSGPQVVKPPTKTNTSYGKNNSQSVPVSLPGTGFSSPILQPRTEKVNHGKDRGSLYVQRSNTKRTVKKSKEPTEDSAENDEVGDRSKRLKARRVRKGIQRQIMKQKSPEVDKSVTPNIAKPNSYSELSLLRKSPPLNIRSGRLTLKPNIVPGFFSKGKSSTTIRTANNKPKRPAIPAKLNKMPNEQPASTSVRTASPSLTEAVRSEDEGSRNGVRQAIAMPDSDHTPNLCPPKLSNINRETTTKTGVPSTVSQHSCRYSDVWDIEVEKPLPSDASSIKGAGSRQPEPEQPKDRGILGSTPAIQKQHSHHKVYLDSDDITTPTRNAQSVGHVVLRKTPNANTFFWMPYSSQRIPRANNVVPSLSVEDILDFHGAQEQLGDDLEFISPIRSNSQTHIHTSRLDLDGMDALNSPDFSVESHSGLDGYDHCDRHEIPSPWPQIGNSNDFEDIMQDSYPYSISHGNNAYDYMANYETEGDFSINVNVRTDTPALGQRELGVAGHHNSTLYPLFQTMTGGNWDSEEELEKNLHNHWQPQRF